MKRIFCHLQLLKMRKLLMLVRQASGMSRTRLTPLHYCQSKDSFRI